MREEIRQLSKEIRREIAENLCAELALDEEDLMAILRAEIRVEMKSSIEAQAVDILGERLVEDIRNEVYDNVLEEVRNLSFENMMKAYRADGELVREVKDELRLELLTSVRDELRAELRGEVAVALKEEMRLDPAVLTEIKEQLSAEIYSEIKHGLR